MRYKILFISSWFPNKLEPTNGNFVQRHAEGVSLVHEVEILHAIGNPDQHENFVTDDREINGIRTIIVYYKNSGNPLKNFRNRMAAYNKGFKMLQKPDLIHANILHNNLLFVLYLNRKFSIPFVVSEHWSVFLQINRTKLSKTTWKLAKYMASKASYLMPVSNNLKENLHKLRIGKKYKVVENVVNTELFKPSNLKNEKFRFLHISNLVKLKNPEKIIRAAVRLRDEFQNFELEIGGDGDTAPLKKLIFESKAEDYVKTFTEIPLAEVAEKMRNSSTFVLFSDYENLPCVLLESMSSGIPVIATKVGGIPEIVNENCGILIDVSEDELYAAMKKMLLNRENLLSSSELHQYISENFSMQKIAQKFDEVYQEVLSNKISEK